METTVSSNEEVETVENVQSILVEKDDKTTKINLRNRNIDKDMLEKLLDEIDLPYYDISEIDLRGSTFCSVPWSENRAGNEQKYKILQHPKLRDVIVVTEDCIKPKSSRKSSSKTKTSSGSITEVPLDSFRNAAHKRHSTQSLPIFPVKGEVADSLSIRQNEKSFIQQRKYNETEE